MLAKRIIPTVLVRGKTAFKGPGFGAQCTRSIGSALAACRTHAARGVDELCILDIAATAEGRGPDLDLVRELSEECFIPITVGGGVRSLQDVDALLRAGADKVAIGARAREEPSFLELAADRFGSQALVQIIECRAMSIRLSLFAGEVLAVFPDREATMCGYDLGVISILASHLQVPLIACGGCSGEEDMLAAFKAGADACAVGALFTFTDATPRGAARYLKAQGLEMRL